MNSNAAVKSGDVSTRIVEGTRVEVGNVEPNFQNKREDRTRKCVAYMHILD